MYVCYLQSFVNIIRHIASLLIRLQPTTNNLGLYEYNRHRIGYCYRPVQNVYLLTSDTTSRRARVHIRRPVKTSHRQLVRDFVA